MARTPVGITAQGNAQVDTAQSKFGGGSALFDGVSDALAIHGGDAISGLIHSTAFTVEGWINRDTGGDSFKHILSNNWYDATNAQWTLVVNTNSQLAFYWTATGDSGNNSNIAGTTTLYTDVWYHVALTCDGNGTLKLFVDGVEEASASNATIYDSADTFVKIGSTGRYVDEGNYAGSIDELRVSNAQRYTANFTPSTTPHVNDADTLLLLHMDGTDGSTVFEDDNSFYVEDTGEVKEGTATLTSSFTLTASLEVATTRTPVTVVALGDAQVDTANSKFGGASAVFDGNGDGLEIQDMSFHLKDSDVFTIEMWFNSDLLQFGRTLYSSNYFSDDNFFVLNTYNNRVSAAFYDSNGNATNVASASTLSTNTWYHVAMVSNGAGNIKVYINGNLEIDESGITIKTASTTNYPLIGRSIGGDYYDGHIDEIRVSSVARYTTAFTPPSTAFTNDNDTMLLLHCDGTDGSTTFEDDAELYAGVTREGVASLSSAFTQTAQATRIQQGGASLATTTSVTATVERLRTVVVALNSTFTASVNEQRIRGFDVDLQAAFSPNIVVSATKNYEVVLNTNASLVAELSVTRSAESLLEFFADLNAQADRIRGFANDLQSTSTLNADVQALKQFDAAFSSDTTVEAEPSIFKGPNNTTFDTSTALTADANVVVGAQASLTSTVTIIFEDDNVVSLRDLTLSGTFDLDASANTTRNLSALLTSDTNLTVVGNVGTTKFATVNLNTTSALDANVGLLADASADFDSAFALTALTKLQILEKYVHSIPSELRTYKIPNEVRTHTIQHENRTFNIGDS